MTYCKTFPMCCFLSLYVTFIAKASHQDSIYLQPSHNTNKKEIGRYKEISYVHVVLLDLENKTFLEIACLL